MGNTAIYKKTWNGVNMQIRETVGRCKYFMHVFFSLNFLSFRNTYHDGCQWGEGAVFLTIGCVLCGWYKYFLDAFIILYLSFRNTFHDGGGSVFLTVGCLDDTYTSWLWCFFFFSFFFVI